MAVAREKEVADREEVRVIVARLGKPEHLVPGRVPTKANDGSAATLQKASPATVRKGEAAAEALGRGRQVPLDATVRPPEDATGAPDPQRPLNPLSRF